MSNKEFEMFLQLIATLLKKGDTEEVLRIIENYAGQIGSEAETKKD